MPWILTCAAGLLWALSQSGSPMNDKPSSVRVAVCQVFCIDSDPEGNLRRVQYAVEDAARQHADIACFPESSILGWVNPEAHRVAEPIPGPLTGRLSDLARRHRMMICIGMDEKEGNHLYDSAVLIGADGELLLKHRKINNLSDARLMDPPYTDGRAEDIRVVATPIGRVGVLICADTFVENHVTAIGRQRPDVLLVPYGWAARKSEWPAHGAELKKTVSRAARWAGCPVVGTDCVGLITGGPWAGRTYGGQSVVADRRGEVVAVLRDRDAEVRIVEIQPGRGE